MDRKAGRMKSELSNVLQDADYANASEFYTELFMVREESKGMKRLVRNGSRSVLRWNL